MTWLARRNLMPPLLPVAALVLLIAACILIRGMADYSLWFDEVNMVDAANSIHAPHDLFDNKDGLRGHPPLFFILLKLWINFAGLSDVALRTLTVLCALLTTAWVFRIGKDFTQQSWGGVFATLMLVGMGFFRQYAHTTHNYALFTLLATLLLFCHERYWLGKGGRVYLGLAFFTLVSLLYTHYHAFYIIGALAIHALMIGIRQRKKLIKWGGVHVLAGLLFIPWLPHISSVYNDFYLDVVNTSLMPSTEPTSWHLAKKIVQILLYDGEYVYFAALFMALAVVLAYPLGTGRRSLSILGMLASFLVLGLGLSLLGNAVVQTLAPRRGIFLVVGIALWIGFGLAHLPLPLASVGLLGIIILTPNVPMPAHVGADWHYDDPIAYVADYAEIGDMLMINYGDSFVGRPMRYYTNRLLPSTIPYITALTETAHVYNLAWARDRLWVIWDDAQPIAEWQGLLAQKKYVEIDRQMVYDWQISLFEDTASPHTLPAPETAVYSTQSHLPQIFGGVFVLNDYRVNQRVFQPGDTLMIWFEWSIQHPVMVENSVFVHLVEDDLVTMHGQGDAAPEHLGYALPTPYWPISTPIYDTHTLTIEPDTPPGMYNVRIGVYDHIQPDRYPVDPGDASGARDGFILMQIEVVPGD